MPNYRRIKVAGGTYFFTVVTSRRRPVLASEDIRRELRCGIAKARRDYPFTVEAWVLLPDHMHCVWTLPDDDPDFSVRWAIIKGHVGKAYARLRLHTANHEKSERRRKESGLWQPRFWEHLIRDEADYWKHVDYIHWNPVKHGHVTRAEDWPYSTFKRFVSAGVYDANWGCSDDEFGEVHFGE